MDDVTMCPSRHDIKRGWRKPLHAMRDGMKGWKAKGHQRGSWGQLESIEA